MTKTIVGLAVAAMSAYAQGYYQANIHGGGGANGKCTVEVEVDTAADVILAGAGGQIRTLRGSPASWIRMNCTSPIPANPVGFRFQGIDGRGRQTLVADPSSNRGTAVVRVEDPNNGRERYTFDIYWSNNGYGNGGYNTGVYNNGANGYPNNGYPNNGSYPVYGGGNYPNNGGYPVYGNGNQVNGGNYPNNGGYPAYGNTYPNNGYPVVVRPPRRHRRDNDGDEDDFPRNNRR